MERVPVGDGLFGSCALGRVPAVNVILAACFYVAL